jgi:hypothetical protein
VSEDKTVLLRNHDAAATGASVAAAFSALIMLPAVEKTVK